VINGVLVVENKYHGQTMAVVDLTLERAAGGWRVAGRSSHPVELASYDPDPAILKLMAPYDERAKSYAHEVIGTLVGGPLAPEGEFAAIPQAVVSDTPLIEFINTVQLHYSGADVSAAACFSAKANAQPGPLRRCDVSRIYKYDNTLYTLEMTGSQLRTYLEWSASYYNTLKEGDLSLSFDPGKPVYVYDMFQGVNYQINVAKEPGARVEGLSWPDGRPVEDADVFVLATNNYRATSALLIPDDIFDKDDMPVLRETDVCGNIGSVRELIVDYIENVLGGELRPECDDNWRLTGIAWDQGLHKQAVDLVADGTLTMKTDDKHLPSVAITEADVRAATPAAAA
jgi:2',3'-cyclic-nucleotide 2'-phosphodiesterase/3'-nucleotidase